MREKRLMKYYQNGNDAFRLKKYSKNLPEESG
jgi:hypothetical protein